jgi:Serine dehydrogenase proteinase
MQSHAEKRISQAHAKLLALEKKRKSRIFIFAQSGDDHLCTSAHGNVFMARHEFQKIDTLEVMLHSGGGHADIAYQIAKFFRRHCKRLHMIVPFMAKSAATLMCLAADTIFMAEHAELGPLDVQITDPLEKGLRPFSPLDEFKSMEYLRDYSTEVMDYFANLIIDRSGMSVKEALHEAIPAVIGMMSPLYAQIDPSKVGSFRQSLAIGEEYAKRILKMRKYHDAEGLAQKLVWNYPTHDFVIDCEEAKEIGLPVQRLDAKDEEDFMDVISGLLHSGDSTYGFAKEPTRPKSTAKKRVQPGRKRPAIVPATPAAEKLKAV